MNEMTNQAGGAFRNQAVAAQGLPSVAELDWQGLSPRYRLAVLAVSVPFWLVLLVAALIVPWVLPEDALPEPLLIGLNFAWVLVPLAILSVGLTVLRIRFMRYAVREHDVSFRKGIIWRSSSYLPYSRIQHVGVDSGPVDRFFGLRRLTFFTAGSIGADLSIPGLPVDTAERLRQYIVDQAGLEDDEH